MVNLTGRTGTQHSYKMVMQEPFRCRADVQCSTGSACLLKYVTVYATKASDCLEFSSRDRTHGSPSEQSKWQQVYRLLSKHVSLQPEMALEFASFMFDCINAPVPHSKPQNNSRRLCEVFLMWLEGGASPQGTARASPSQII